MGTPSSEEDARQQHCSQYGAVPRTRPSNVALEPPRAISAEQLRSGVHGWFRQKREKQEPLVSVVSVPSFLHKQHVLSASQHSRAQVEQIIATAGYVRQLQAE